MLKARSKYVVMAAILILGLVFTTLLQTSTTNQRQNFAVLKYMPLAVVQDTPLAVAHDTPLAVFHDTPLASVQETPLYVALDTPLAVSQDTPRAVVQDTPLIFSNNTPIEIEMETVLTVAKDTPVHATNHTQHAVSTVALLANSRDTPLKVAKNETNTSLQPDALARYFNSTTSTKTMVNNTRLLRFIEEIIESDDSRGRPITQLTVPQVTCPDQPQQTRIEDLLCMQPPKFQPVYKNPCFFASNGLFHCLPYFQIIGMDKSGTTDLFDKIARHPEVHGNNGTLQKETMWWSWRRYGLWLRGKIEVQKFNRYVEYFDGAAAEIQRNPRHVTGDGTPMDMWDMRGWPEIPQNAGQESPRFTTPHLIHHINPGVRLLAIFREPTRRLESDYFFLKIGKQTRESLHVEIAKAIVSLHECTRKATLRTCLYKKDLIEKLNARIHLGFYSVYLREWLQVFPRDQLLLFRTEDYSRSPQRHLQTVFSYLGLEHVTDDTLHAMTSSKRKHVTKKAKGAGILDETKALLQALYAPFNRDLAHILQDDSYLWSDV
ncbi:carbohydrate sulfotransferase 15-like isoform X4 [Dreissena polymorpha]|uniref:carbohydrate sulfotransferase 15-like isoform X3 n=1 Tax=Dreissena polymorpha TaxID=45954 RepID=UPI0022656519|nr:carbohydrate sulfotransferase 15-like isoform X3 [Dreissena polymorpha]XP_052252126.1 carbohydrate sulfotransferase 15-like isoform X4 [Dreissena polymorpha]